jgi:hypothetical protein
MFGAYPFGEPYFGQAPNRTAVIVLFGKICDTALVSLNAAHRLLSRDGSREIRAIGPAMRLLGRYGTHGLSGHERRTVKCSHD